MIATCPRCGHRRHVKHECQTCRLFHTKGVFQ